MAHGGMVHRSHLEICYGNIGFHVGNAKLAACVQCFCYIRVSQLLPNIDMQGIHSKALSILISCLRLQVHDARQVLLYGEEGK
jgi:hypothetical protein